MRPTDQWGNGVSNPPVRSTFKKPAAPMASKKKRKYSKEKLEQLTELKGIGPATAKKILDTFTGLKEFRDADMPTLQTVLGKKKGEDIFIELHGADAPRGPQGPNPMGRSTKYSEELGQKIADDYAQGTGTVAEIMAKYGLSERIFYYWQEENLQFFQLIKNAKEARQGQKLHMALNGMKILLQGHEYTEQDTEATPIKNADGTTSKVIKKTVVKRKFIPPNATMVIFTLCNIDPENWKSVQHIKHEGGAEMPPYDFSNFTMEELETFERLSKKAQTNTNGVG